MKKQWLIAFCAGLLMLSGSVARGDVFPSKVKNPQVMLELLSEQQGIVPGESFTLGLRITHAPKYHTYWEYPGVVGIPTEFQWKLPKGFTAGEVQWPRPEQTKMGAATGLPLQ